MQENSQFTLTGPLIWCDNLQVRLWTISIKNDSSHGHVSDMYNSLGLFQALKTALREAVEVKHYLALFSTD